MFKKLTSRFSRKAVQKELKQFYTKRLRFLRRRRNVEEQYPYEILDPYEIFGDAADRSLFSLVGENWKALVAKKPVALMVGFNTWKWGFMAGYLPDHRIAFAPRKITTLSLLYRLRSFPEKIETLYVWGYTEPATVSHFARKYNIKLIRVEDGFLRSSNLGAMHATPYSLVFDQAGLYYDPSTPSQLEQLLNQHHFSEPELAAANESLQLLLGLRLSKYNPPAISPTLPSSVSLKRRIAVIGQVDNDMSVRLGNVDNWRSADMVRLAKFENPEAEIFYRPHPEVYKGFQRSRFATRALAQICTVVSPEVPLSDFLDTVDHVYTITSLAGLEALLRGKTVTVMGAAFYAGWGLTDDRVAVPRRERERSVLELFCAVYLLYPKYLADLQDTRRGLTAACLRIKADQQVNENRLFDELDTDKQENAALLATSNYWAKLIFKRGGEGQQAIVSANVKRIPYGRVLLADEGPLFQIGLIYAVLGVCLSNAERDKVIAGIRNYVDFQFLNDLLLELLKVHPGAYIYPHIAWLLSKVGAAEHSVVMLDDYVDKLKRIMREAEKAEKAEQAKQGEETKKAENAENLEKIGKLGKIGKFKNVWKDDERDLGVSTAPVLDMNGEQADLLLLSFDYSYQIRDFDKCVELGKQLLLRGYHLNKIINRFDAIATLRFDAASARGLAKFLAYMEAHSQQGVAALREARAYREEDIEADPVGFLVILAKVIATHPEGIASALFMIKKYEEIYPNTEETGKLLIATLALDNDQSIGKAQAYIAIEDAQRAVKIVERLLETDDGSDELRIVYSQALSYAAELQKAAAVMDRALQRSRSSKNYRERMRLYVLEGKYADALCTLQEAQSRRVDVGDMHPRKIYFGSRRVNDAFKTFCDIRVRNALATYYKSKYAFETATLTDDATLLLVSVFGPGDEIRFASIYNAISATVKGRISITCDPRLASILSRSFPQLSFVPTARPRSHNKLDMAQYSQVPGSDLTGVIDNGAVAAIERSSHVAMTTDMLHRILLDYPSFAGTGYLRPDPAKQPDLGPLVGTKLPLIGLSWRSSLTTHSRNEHYLAVQELAPIFEIDGVQFVNFQYDECSEELRWVEERYPGKLVHYGDIDHYNDFDSVAGLMTAMDLIIAPATTVVELAGALGCSTWLLSNSSELHWRKIDDRGTDVWHHSVTHLEGAVLGSKISLVHELRERIQRFVQAQAQQPARKVS